MLKANEIFLYDYDEAMEGKRCVYRVNGVGDLEGVYSGEILCSSDNIENTSITMNHFKFLKGKSA
jgi:hypothetical protein